MAAADGAPGNEAGGGKRPAWVHPAGEAAALLDADVAPIFLGLDEEGAPHFAGQVSLVGQLDGQQ